MRDANKNMEHLNVVIDRRASNFNLKKGRFSCVSFLNYKTTPNLNDAKFAILLMKIIVLLLKKTKER